MPCIHLTSSGPSGALVSSSGVNEILAKIPTSLCHDVCSIGQLPFAP